MNDDVAVIPTYREAKLGSKFHSLVSKLDQLALDRAGLEKEEKQVRNEVTRMLAERGEKAVMVDNLRVTFVSGTGPSHISKDLLLKYKVPVATILKCTIKGKPYETVMITRKKDNSNEQ